jgi:hypothetical protein
VVDSFWRVNQPFASLHFLAAHERGETFQIITAFRADLIADAPDFLQQIISYAGL